MPVNNSWLTTAVTFLKGNNSIRFDSEIAEKMGVSQPVVSNYLKGRVQTSKNFEKKFKETFPECFENINSKNNSNQVPHHYNKMVPYYDLDAIGGTTEIFTDGKELVSAYISLPGFDDCDCFLNYSGDSMFPKYKSGQIIGLKRITDFEIIQYGEAFMIVTRENRMIKYIRKGTTEERILLVSENPKFDSFEIPKQKVLFLFIVKGNIEKNVL